jgi:hypothetical protein
MTWCINRLTAIGSKRQVQLFQKSNWATALGARHCELLENSPARFACQFETEAPPLESLGELSRRWPRLTLLLDYEAEEERIKGLAKAQAGQIASCQLEY